ncbi:MAG: hypothetical protein M1136_05635 [Chloroflexi bacterium]|nr:hypothetical protein [Chloroflexota bacterium]
MTQEHLRWTGSASSDSIIYDHVVGVSYREKTLTGEQLNQLRAYYGMPKDSEIRLVKYQGDELAPLWGELWRPYQANGLGVLTPNAVPPCLDLGGEIVQLYELRVQRPDSPLYLQVRWHPSLGERISLCGLEHEHTKGDWNHARASLTLLKKLTRRGRPEWSGIFPSPELFIEAAKKGIRAIRAEGKHPSQERVADYLRSAHNVAGCEARSLRSWCSKTTYRNWQKLLSDTK